MTIQEELGQRLSGNSSGSGHASAAASTGATTTVSSPTAVVQIPSAHLSPRLDGMRLPNPSTVIHIPVASTVSDPERTYVFPARSAFGSAPKTRVGEITAARGHSRSVSHGGGTLSCSQPNSSHAASSSVGHSTSKVLRSAMKGHQRALSQGQIGVTDSLSGASCRPDKKSGHNRVGSKTDFILPPGHKETIVPRGDLVSSGSSAGRDSGHSRQASRSESIYTLRRAEMPPWWKRMLCMCPGGSQFQEDRHRIVVPNHTVPLKTPKRDHPNGRRVGNKIRTTKYTLLSFIPNNLLEQFHRLANLYFIFIVLLNWYIGAFGRQISIIPVGFVLGVTAVKDLFEDRRRRASDKRINNSTCRVYNG